MESLSQKVDYTFRVGSGPVDFIDEEEGGDLILPQQTPNGFRMALYPFHGADYHHGSVQHPETALHFRGEIPVARGIHQIPGSLLPDKGRLAAEDGDTPLFFQRIGIQKAVLMVHPASPADGVGLKENLLGQGGFSGVYMGQNSHSAGLLHGVPFPSAIAKSSASESTGIPSFSAFASLLPASSPATT